MTGTNSFNRLRGLGLIFLLSLGVAAAGLAFWMQQWETQIVNATKSGTSDTFTYTYTRGMQYKVETNYDSLSGTTTTAQTDLVQDFRNNGSTCGQFCLFNFINYIIQIVGTSVGLATVAAWIIMVIFGTMRHGLLATTGIWITGLCQGASCALFIYNNKNDWTKDMSSVVPNLYSMTNMQTMYGYSFGLAMGSACWCLVVIGIYVNSCRNSAKLSDARAEVAPLDFGRSASGARDLAAASASNNGGNKSAAWVV